MSADMSAESKAIHVVQITDCHLKRDPGGELLGMNTRDSFEAVFALAKKNSPAPDYVIASGDLAQDGSVEAYDYFKQRMDAYGRPISWFPGNHDDKDNMLKVVGGGEEFDSVRIFGNWQFILLDSLVPGSVHGRLSPKEISTLESALSARPDLNTVVCLHHHVIDIACRWLDGINLKNNDELRRIVATHPNVKMVLCGHIHQELDEVIDGCRYVASPSTCIQFMPKSNDFAIDPIAPGYRWFNLYADGKIETGVERATDFEFEIDMESDGY